MSAIAILGSSNSQGNTRILCHECIQAAGAELIDLNCFSISPWDYDGQNSGDDFALIANKLVLSSDIIFCTPVYWYSMSAQMKVFFDRLSDLITRRKSVGRALAGRRTWLIASGTDPELPEGFEIPFQRTSEYFDMDYCGAFYGQAANDRFHQDTLRRAKAFGIKIVGQTGGASQPKSAPRS